MSVQKASDALWFDPASTRLVGDPVDVVTGRVTERTLCFRLIGPLFLELYRHYNSGRNTLQRGLGFGHTHSYDHRLSFDVDGLLLEEPVGRRIGFPPLRGDGEMHTVRGATLRRLSLFGYRLTRPGAPAIDFTFVDPETPARVRRVQHRDARIEFHYGPGDHLVGLVHSTGLHIAAEEDATHRLLSLTGPWDGGTTHRPILQCSYDAEGNLVGMVDALKRQSRFAYDAHHRLIRRTDRRGYSFLFEYDASGRCVRSAGEDGVMGVILHYRADELITEVTRSDGGVWHYYYDRGGFITQVIGPYGDVLRFIRGENGRAIGEIDPLGNGLDYVFSTSANLIGKRFATGRTVAIEAGIEKAAPPLHLVADRASQFLFGMLPRRLPIASGGVPTAMSGAARELAPVAEALPSSPRVPPFGALPWYPEPSEGREFTPFGHLVRQALPCGSARKWNYDPNDSVYESRDADGGVTLQKRRSWNQLEALIDPLGNRTLYQFSTEDKVTKVTDPGGTATDFAWDKKRRLTGVRRAGQVRDRYSYDGAGNLVEKRNGAGVVLLTLVPSSDRLKSERHLASGGVHRFTYDTEGRLLTAAVDESTVRFAYDLAGRRILDTRDGLGVEHDYRAGSKPITTMLFGRFIVTRALEAGALRISLPGGAWICIERLTGCVVLRRSSSGTAELWQHDVMGRCLASIVMPERAPAHRWTRRWRYSAEGDLLEAEDSRYGTSSYRFDAAHRLVSVEKRGISVADHLHDAAGNLLMQQDLRGVELALGNRLGAANGERFSYDIRQHVSERRGPRGVTLYRYDSRDMLVQAQTPGGPWQAEYDAIGRRVRVCWARCERQFFWDTDRLAAEIREDGMLRVYIYADERALTPLAFIDYPDMNADPSKGQVRFVYADQRGAPVLVEGGTAEQLWEARLAPYGAAVVRDGARIVLDLRFPGHYFDAATGLHYNRFRYYDPLLGRYIQSDPAGLGGGANVYAYPSNPLVHVDVRGQTLGTGAACGDESCDDINEDPDERESSSPLYGGELDEDDLFGMHVVDPEDIDGQSASRSHAEALGAALEESGDFQPDDNYEPHHIVPWDHPRAAEARGILSDAGIGVDDAENGVWLPRTTRDQDAREGTRSDAFSSHDSAHTASNIDDLTDRLRAAGPENAAAVLADEKARYLLGDGRR